jgi:D-alanyl-lipoteichoic acid acyltransferase DltB (MBOAT superfamily)
MNFAKPSFLIFLTVVALVVLALTSPKKRKLFLLAASYFFYGTWSVPFIGLILASTSLDYWFSKKIFASTDATRRKLLLATGIAINLIILGIFKYCNFFIDTTNSTLAFLHMQLVYIHPLKLLLPLGISFYTFEAISYLVDVFRGEAPAETFFDYNFYIMYFPHLISGPIVRYRELSSQMKDGIFLSLKNVQKGFELIVLGLVFKLLIADTVSGLAEGAFQNPSVVTVGQTYLAWAAFTAQIYFDFMGYTHIARGVSLLFNINLPLNFDHPYNAQNISNFWQRWHISLSRWIRDYLYIPLGGSRNGGAARTCFNLLLTMTIAGAWHGAGWAFILWGAYHGLLLLMYHITSPLRKIVSISSSKSMWSNWLYKAAGGLSTFLLVAYGWIWFRSPDTQTALAFSGKLCQLNTLFLEQSRAIRQDGDFSWFATMFLLLVLCSGGPLAVRIYNSSFQALPRWAKIQAATAIFVICYIMSGAESKPFIYFQF